MIKSLKRIYIGLILIFMYAPIITLIVMSFNASKSRSKWGGFTFKWYVELFQNEEIMGALFNTLVIAFLSALIATVIGLVACMTMQKMGRKSRSIITGITNIPMLNAEIVTGISLMLLFLSFGNILSYFGIRFQMGFMTVLISHITFNIPYAILSILPRMKQLNPSVYEAALDLGATKFTAFRKVVLPDLLPGISSGFLMAFTMSIDDFIITHFTKGPGFDTLSTKIYTELRKGIKPEMYALSTLIFIAVFLLLLLVNRTPKDQPEKH
jgi:spermidine/putrescine transport system permease protein